MAKKFNNGQTFGEIRQILNDNADEINANTTTAKQAKIAAEVNANGSTAGRVQGSLNGLKGGVGTVNQLLEQGVMYYADGKGIPTAWVLTSFNFNNSGDLMALGFGTLFYLSGSMLQATAGSVDYLGGWKKGFAKALLVMAEGHAVALDLDTRMIWLCIRDSNVLVHWEKVGGGSDYTLPVASSTTLGGIKVGSGLKIASDGTLSTSGNGNGGDSTELITTELRDNAIPKPTPDAVKVYTFEGYKEGMPTKLKGFPFSGVLTVYPNGLLTMLVTGFYEDPTEQEGAPYLSMNGLWTYTGGVGDGWHKNYEVSFPATMTKTDTGKEVEN